MILYFNCIDKSWLFLGYVDTTQTIMILNFCSALVPWYRQMGELWRLLEFACLQHFTCNMVVKMGSNISRVLFCSTIFSKLKLNGMKFGKINRKNIAGQSYPSIWGNFGHPGETLDSRLLCTSNDLEWLLSTSFMMTNLPMITVDHK